MSRTDPREGVATTTFGTVSVCFFPGKPGNLDDTVTTIDPVTNAGTDVSPRRLSW
jgi:hypothetical protein